MRKSYLESYYNILPSAQQDRLLSVLKQRSDESGTQLGDSDIANQLTKLIAQIGKPMGDPLVKLRKAVRFGKISSKDYNDTMDEVYVDLGALFKQDNAINKTTKIHNSLNQSVLADVESSLSKVSNDITVYKMIKDNKQGITDVKFNTFYKNDNTSLDENFSAEVDTEINCVKLPKGIDHQSTSIGGLSMANIDVYHYGGGILGTIEDESHRKEKAIDGSKETFWGEVVLTDEPIRQTYSGSTYFGAVCEVVITLFRTDIINHIRLNPFSNYPLSIVSISYSDTESGAWVDLGVDPQESTLPMEFNFTSVSAKKIKIVMNQKNPSINTYKIPRNVINNAQMWQQIVNREYSISTETDEPIQASQDMIDYVTGWQAYVDASNDFQKQLNKIGNPENYTSTGSISESIFDATTNEIVKSGTSESVSPLKLDLYGKKPLSVNELIEVRKYEYVYGAYNIDISRIWYLEKGEYVSPRYSSNGNISDVYIDVNEIVPSGTTIEYQVSTRQGEWLNILPSAGYISKERVDLDTVSQIGTLRFACSGSIMAGLYRNDIPIPNDGYSFDVGKSEIVVGSGWYTSSSAFTASYKPAGTYDLVPSGVSVSFLSDPEQTAQETFTGTTSRQYKISLQHYPYVNYSIINDTSDAGDSDPSFSNEDGRWQNIKTGTVSGVSPSGYYDVVSALVDGFLAINRTDYYTGIKPALTKFDNVNYPYYEYIHAGKNIYFNTELSGRTVKVQYQYLNDFIQFKALLRNNTRGDVSSTPILQDFTLKMRTI
jgi:hypothetical protein